MKTLFFIEHRKMLNHAVFVKCWKYCYICISGTEVTGIVQEVGKNVKTLKKGDKVVSLIMSGGFSTHCIAPEVVSIMYYG